MRRTEANGAMDNREEYLRSKLAELARGCPPGSAGELSLPVDDAVWTIAIKTAGPPPVRIKPCMRDTLITLCEIFPRQLTTEALHALMWERKREWGLSTLKRGLSELGRAGLVDNAHDHLGYIITAAGAAIVKPLLPPAKP